MNHAFTWPTAMAVAVGASLGAWARWAAGVLLGSLWPGFPLGTLLVKCVGGLLIGMTLVVFERWPHELLRMFAVTGLLGGLTTFSTFTGESLGLLQRGEWPLAVVRTLAHLLGSLACAALGFWLMASIWRA